jgi:hypothetical protein
MACKVTNCSKKEFQDGLCSIHYRERANQAPKAAPVAHNFALGRTGGVVNVQFAALAACRTPPDHFALRIDSLTSEGSRHGGEEECHGVWCLHETQKGGNVTVWYSWIGNTMDVWGLGRHKGGDGAGNDSYEMLWFDGTNKNWTRNKKKKK